jgi:lysophospholipase L1-like esterase
MEPTNGVVVDNFSFRGITGLELAKLDTSFLQALQQENKYDLIILEYGANLLFRPNDMDYTWYQSHINPVVNRLKHAMSGAEILIISTSDRAFKYGESWHSANGIHNLIKAQADLAYTNGTAFYNMFSSMGGDGTIVKWADSTTPIANKDYIHPNHKGAEILGTMFYNDFMKEYSKQVLHTTHKSDFVTTNSGTIIDKKNNLEWCIASDKDYSWNEANQWIKNLNADTGLWHLPTSEQLIMLFDKKESSGYGYMWQGKIFTAKIDTAFGKIGHSCWVWTNEMLGSEKAYSVNFSEGIKVVSLKNTKDYPIRVFAVRKLRSS